VPSGQFERMRERGLTAAEADEFERKGLPRPRVGDMADEYGSSSGGTPAAYLAAAGREAHMSGNTVDSDVADQLVSAVKGWVRREAEPWVAEFDRADSFPAPLVDQMKDLGLFGTQIRVRYGGSGLDVPTYARWIKELGYGWIPLAGILNTHMIGANLINRFGMDEQKQRWEPKMATSEVRAAFSLSEADAGSDIEVSRHDEHSSSRVSRARAALGSTPG
jgi:alkylation response protein AidB-like acyl-CoA dehydrogenase